MLKKTFMTNVTTYQKQSKTSWLPW